MRLLRPLSRSITRPISILVLIAWIATMAALVNRSYLQASSANLATDLARYGSAAVWRGVYYRGEKIGFTVSQTVPTDDGFELQEDGRLQMSLLGATTAATIQTTARVDANFALRSFEFSLDPGTGPIDVRGQVDVTVGAGRSRLTLDVTTSAGTRTEARQLTEPPALSLNLSRRLANGGLVPGARHQWTLFDPATLQQRARGHRRRQARARARRPTRRSRRSASRWTFSGLQHDRRGSPTPARSSARRARWASSRCASRPTARRPWPCPDGVQADLLEAAAVVPVMTAAHRRAARRSPAAPAARRRRPLERGPSGRRPDGRRRRRRAPRSARAARRGRPTPTRSSTSRPKPFIESDAPEIRAEAEIAVRGVTGARARAERLTRYVNALLDKKPTVSLPSAREVLRTKVGDCNEHTALYVAMARALGIPARIAVGLVYMHGAFYYHAWPEVYLDEGAGRGLWLPVDPTLNQFPADATHLRLARGGLDKQAAILPLDRPPEDDGARPRARAGLHADPRRAAPWTSALSIPIRQPARAARAALPAQPRMVA